MSIDDIKPSDAAKPYSGNPQGQGGRQSGYGPFQGQAKDPAPKRNINDVTSFMNIPQAELTPAVSDAIISLMEEVDHLRHELSMMHGLEAMLSKSVDRDMDLPVLTRHALCREAVLIAAQLERSAVEATFVYFQISNFAEIKKRSGLLAAESVMREVAETLLSQLRKTDRIGTLGGDGFGMVLSITNMEGALKKVQHLEELVKTGPVMHNGHIIDLEVAYGLHNLHPDEKINTILNEADKDLHKRFVRL